MILYILLIPHLSFPFYFPAAVNNVGYIVPSWSTDDPDYTSLSGGYEQPVASDNH